MSLPFSPRKETTVELYPKRNEFGVAKKKKAYVCKRNGQSFAPFYCALRVEHFVINLYEGSNRVFLLNLCHELVEGI
jgi:hypothetical protein